MASNFDKYLKSNLSKEDLDAVHKQGENLHVKGSKSEHVHDIEEAKNQTHKNQTGKDLDQNLYGEGKAQSSYKPLNEDVKKQAKDSLANYPTKEHQPIQSNEQDKER